MYEHELAPTSVVKLVADKLLLDPASIPNMLNQYAKGRTITVDGDTYAIYVGRLREILTDKGWTPPEKRVYTVDDVTI